jgi:hypothetical protein
MLCPMMMVPSEIDVDKFNWFVGEFQFQFLKKVEKLRFMQSKACELVSERYLRKLQSATTNATNKLNRFYE